jgi:lipopolysaccharide biosynthesis protein
METLGSRLNLKIDYKLGFCAASMFWFKPHALSSLLDLKLKPADFEPETGQVDGTTSHAIERLIGQVVDANHYRVITERETLNECFSDGATIITDSYKFVD